MAQTCIQTLRGIPSGYCYFLPLYIIHSVIDDLIQYNYLVNIMLEFRFSRDCIHMNGCTPVYTALISNNFLERAAYHSHSRCSCFLHQSTKLHQLQLDNLNRIKTVSVGVCIGFTRLLERSADLTIVISFLKPPTRMKEQSANSRIYQDSDVSLRVRIELWYVTVFTKNRDIASYQLVMMVNDVVYLKPPCRSFRRT